MDEKEIIMKLISGKYFEKEDYFTEKQLKSFKPFISDFRELLKNKEKKGYFRNLVASLISSDDIRKVLLGANFGRYYLDDKEMYTRLEQLVEHPLHPFKIKVQIIYELLVGKSTDKDKKQEWYKFLIDNLEKYKQLFKQVYRIDSEEKKEEYFSILKKKLLETLDNKKWVYFIELVVLGINKKKTRKIIAEYTSSKDEFISMVAKRCLQKI